MKWTHDAIVLRPSPFQEGGLVVSFLSSDGERLAGLARGAKKPSAKWVAAFEPMSLVRVEFFGKEHLDVRRITRCDLQHSPMTLGHLDSSLAISCIADLLDRVAKEGLEDPRLFRLALSCSRVLKAQPDRAMSVLAYAEHWLLHCLGLLPRPIACGRCGNAHSPFAGLGEHGWHCIDCLPAPPGGPLPPGAKEYLQKLRGAKAEDMPDAYETPASRAITMLLRAKLLEELGPLKSYEVLAAAL
ncbi:MAG: DNA repair protein RecO [Holophagales bacterium]|nr:DNA repair protein RecO [Holophagales bacterium]